MPTFAQLHDDFYCPYQHGCPYLEGLSTRMVWHGYQEAAVLAGQYEPIIEQLDQALAAADQREQQKDERIRQLEAQLAALHRRQFKGRKKPRPEPPPDGAEPKQKKRGAPRGHKPWRRPRPQRIDRRVEVLAPRCCPHCQCPGLKPWPERHQHLQEDIVLEPRTQVSCYEHQQAYCPRCDRPVWQSGPGELPGAYIGPAAKATALYLRYQLHVSDRKISRFFADFFGLQFVPASAYNFERQAVRRGLPLYEDLLEKVRALPVAHADETSWRNDGEGHWVWYFGNDELAYYRLTARRTGQVAGSILGARFRGILVSDAYAAYDSIQCQDWQSCLAHIKRKAKELEQELALLKGRAADPAARQFCQAIQGFVQDACRAHRQLTKGPWRAKAARKQEQKWRQELRALCAQPLRYPRAESFRKRLIGPELKHFFTCFRHRGVPPTNNQAERSLRPVVLMRKVVQGTRSAKGLENHSVLRSLFETARRQGKKPQDFFLALFTQKTAQAQAALYRQPLGPKPGKTLQSHHRKKPP